MPEYLAPGVYVEETSFRARSIEGVGTSVAGIVGPTRTGPVRGTPEVVTSINDFERIYGDARDLTFGENTVLNHTAIAARAFFDNGGKQLFVARVIAGGNGTDAAGQGGTAAIARAPQPDPDADADADTPPVRFEARFPGSGGNVALRVNWTDTQSLLRQSVIQGAAAIADTDNMPEGAFGMLRINARLTRTSFRDSVPASAANAHDGFPLQGLTALVVRQGDNLNFVADRQTRVVNAEGNTNPEQVIDVASLGSGFAIDSLPEGSEVRRVWAVAPAGDPVAEGTPAELRLAESVNLAPFAPDRSHWGDDIRFVRGTLNAERTVFSVLPHPFNHGVNEPAAGDDEEPEGYDIHLAALAAEPGAAQSLFLQRNFTIDVLRNGEPFYTVPEVDLVAQNAANDTGQRLPDRLPAAPERRLDQLTQPVSAAIDAGTSAENIYRALLDMMRATDDGLALDPPAGSFRPPQYLITLAGGTDGDAPGAVDYGGETNELLGSTGFAALEEVEDISIVVAPAAAADDQHHQAVTVLMQSHCERMRYRVGIADSREGMALSEIRAFRGNFNTTRMALYYPWVETIDPTGARNSILAPPSGFMAGIFARTDVQRGVHKAPANTPVFGALRFGQGITHFQQELLNPAGVNCLRSFSGRGHQVWGARTMSDDPEWRYVNVRRYFLFLEKSIDKGTQWVVFEPNGERLWANVRTTIADFLYNEWVSGHLLGAKPEDAFFVRCDRSTMTQNDIDAGRLICEIGVAPLRPAEFVIFRIGQITGAGAA